MSTIKNIILFGAGIGMIATLAGCGTASPDRSIVSTTSVAPIGDLSMQTQASGDGSALSPIPESTYDPGPDTEAPRCGTGCVTQEPQSTYDPDVSYDASNEAIDSTNPMTPARLGESVTAGYFPTGTGINLRPKNAICKTKDVDSIGIGTYICSVTFLAIPDPQKFLVEVPADGQWQAQPIA